MSDNVAIRGIIASDASPADIVYFAEVMFLRIQQISIEKDALTVENEYLRQKVERLESEQQAYVALQRAYDALAAWGYEAYRRLRLWAPRSESVKNAPDVVKQNLDLSKDKSVCLTR